MANTLRFSQNALMSEQGTSARKVLDSRSAMTPGTGISSVSTATYDCQVTRLGGEVKTRIFIDLEGLKSGATDGDIIGKSATANCHIGRVTTAINGLVYRGQLTCLEVPATGEPDIDVYSATEATGTQDAAVSGLTETALLASAADFTAAGQTRVFTVAPAADQYLYLVCSGGADNAVYTAGQLILELWGYEA